jgi:hypothetical protein
MVPCSKVRYPSQLTAELALKRFAARCRQRGSRVPTGSYWCGPCSSWHLTSKSPSRPAPWTTKRYTVRATGSAATAKL